jgi:hypothetical protein
MSLSVKDYLSLRHTACGTQNPWLTAGAHARQNPNHTPLRVREALGEVHVACSGPLNSLA